MTSVVIQKAGKYQVQGTVKWCDTGTVVDASDWGKALDRCVRTGYVALVVPMREVAPVVTKVTGLTPAQAAAVAAVGKK